MAGGTQAAANGGNIFVGAVLGAFTAGAGSGGEGFDFSSFVENIASRNFNTSTAGTSSRATGGKFVNGAGSGAFSRANNQTWSSYFPGVEAGDNAARYYAARLVAAGGGFTDDPVASVGLFFSVLWTPDTAAETTFTLFGGEILSLGGKAVASLRVALGIGKTSITAIRQAYVTEVVSLKGLGAIMLKGGASKELVARSLSRMRREIGVKYKQATPWLKRQGIYIRNRAPKWLGGKGYDSIYGPSVNWFRRIGKSWDDIIESAARPNSAINSKLGVQ